MANDSNSADRARSPWSQQTLKNLVVGALALGALGLLLPWVSAGFISANGLDTGDGKLYGAVLLVAIVLVVLWRRSGASALGVITICLAIVLAAIGIYDVIHVATVHGPFGISASPGIGLILDVLAGAGLAFVAVRILRRGRHVAAEGKDETDLQA